MNWSSIFIFYYISSAVTGSLVFGLWWASSILLGKRGPEIVYLGLKGAIAAFFVPLAGIAVLMIDQGGYIRRPGQIFWGRIFAVNTDLLALKLFFLACLAGALVNIVRHIRKQYLLRLILKGGFAENNAVALEEFERIKETMGLKCEIELLRCDYIISPMVVGIFHKKVILPYLNYKDHERKVIFYHELAHYKKHDLAVKIFTMILEIFGSLNPLTYWLAGETDAWCEINGDWVAMSYLEKENVSRKQYYKTIYDIFDEDKFEERNMFDSQMLFRGRSGLERRIDYMRKHVQDEKKRPFPAWAVYAVAVSVMLVSTFSSYAATLMISNLNDALFKATETEIAVEENTGSEPQVKTLDPNWEEKAVYMGKNIGTARGGNVLDWKVEPGTKALSDKIYLPEGTGIFISCIGKPSSCSYNYGIQWGNTEISSPCSGGNTANTFTSDKGRYYYIIVENTGSSTLTINITYNY